MLSAAPRLRFSARLSRNPEAGSFQRADSWFSRLACEREYDLFTSLEPAECGRVLISRSQHYRLLGELVADTSRAFPSATCIVVRFLEPTLLSIPLPLLDPRVMLAHDARSVVALHQPLARDALILTIEDRFRRDNSELNDDSIEICAWGHCGVSAFERYVRATRLFAALADIRFSCVESEASRVGA